MATIAENNIRLLPQQDIDIAKWNACVERNNGKIYNLYSYLSIMCDNWHGIVVGGYTCILAIPWKKKFGLRYIPVVPFVQQLSLLGRVTDIEKKQIVLLLRGFVRYGDYNLDSTLLLDDASIKQRTNFVLNLSLPYTTIKDNYATNLQRNIRKTRELGLVLEDCSCVDALHHYNQTYLEKIPVVKSTYFTRFRKLVELLTADGLSKSCCVKQSGYVVATALFFHHNNRLYNILPCTLARGSSAMHFLLDCVIRQYAGTDTILDFEGSDIPGVRQFYQQFGPVEEYYYQYHFNGLPFPLNKLKS